jgi:hypothetical protein
VYDRSILHMSASRFVLCTYLGPTKSDIAKISPDDLPHRVSSKDRQELFRWILRNSLSDEITVVNRDPAI